MKKSEYRVGGEYVRSSRSKSGWVAVSTVGGSTRFETMVFQAVPGGGKVKSWRDLDSRTYDSRAAAVAGHAAMVAAWESRKPNRVPPPAPAPRIVIKPRAA